MKLSVLAGMMLLVSSATIKAQDADGILHKYIDAIGGIDKLTSIKTIKMTGSSQVQGMDIKYTQTMNLGTAMKVDYSVMGMTGYSVITTTEGWQFNPQTSKVESMTADQVKMAQPQLNMIGGDIFNYKTNGSKVEYLGKDSANKAFCYKVKFTAKDGSVSTQFFDTQTYYLVHTESKVKVEEQEIDVVINYSDYKKLPEGIAMPMTVSSQQGDVTFTSIEINKPIADSVFKRSN